MRKIREHSKIIRIASTLFRKTYKKLLQKFRAIWIDLAFFQEEELLFLFILCIMIDAFCPKLALSALLNRTINVQSICADLSIVQQSDHIHQNQLVTLSVSMIFRCLSIQ